MHKLQGTTKVCQERATRNYPAESINPHIIYPLQQVDDRQSIPSKIFRYLTLLSRIIQVHIELVTSWIPDKLIIHN